MDENEFDGELGENLEAFMKKLSAGKPCVSVESALVLLNLLLFISIFREDQGIRQVCSTSS